MKLVHVASGKTFNHKDRLKELGFRWYPKDKTWVKWFANDISKDEYIKNEISILPGLRYNSEMSDKYIGSEADPIVHRSSPYIKMHESDQFALSQHEEHSPKATNSIMKLIEEKMIKEGWSDRDSQSYYQFLRMLTDDEVVDYFDEHDLF